MMDKKIACSIIILKNAHIPLINRFAFVLERTPQLIVSINCWRSGYADMRIIIVHRIGMHQHDILSCLGTLHHLHTFTHPLRTKDAVLLNR